MDLIKTMVNHNAVNVKYPMQMVLFESNRMLFKINVGLFLKEYLFVFLALSHYDKRKVDPEHITQIVNVNLCALYHIKATLLFVNLKVNVNI